MAEPKKEVNFKFLVAPKRELQVEKPKAVAAVKSEVNEELEKMVRILSRVNPEASIESIRAEAEKMIGIDIPTLLDKPTPTEESEGEKQAE